MIVVNCIGHSGFTVESETHMLLFDYWKGGLPRLPAKKKLYVFVTHSHEDHFNPAIFRNSVSSMTGILSSRALCSFVVLLFG